MAINKKNYKESDPPIRELNTHDVFRYKKETTTPIVDNGDYNEAVQNVLDKDGELGSKEYNSIFGMVEKGREGFINANKKGKALAIKDLNDKSLAIKNFKSFRQDLAAAYNTRSTMTGWHKTEEGSQIMALLGDEARLTMKECGDGETDCEGKDELGVILPDFAKIRNIENTIQSISFGSANKSKLNKKELEDLQKELDEEKEIGSWVSIGNLPKRIKMKDESTKKIISEMGNNYLTQSSQTNDMENVAFPKAAAERQVRVNVLRKSANFESLVYDEMIPGRSFRHDLIESAMANSYADLGVDDIEGVNSSDGIDEEEAILIAEAMIGSNEHRSILEDEMTNYFVSYLENQWNAGRGNRPNPSGVNKFSSRENLMTKDAVEDTNTFARSLGAEKYNPGKL